MAMIVILMCIVLQIFWTPANAIFNFELFLNTSDVRGDVSQFWKSTGFSPPLPHEDAGAFDLSPDMKLNLAYIGAMPHDGISQVRVRWLLDLVKVKVITASTGPWYDFTQLDEFVALMHENDLSIGFELMGNPSNIYTDMENRTQVLWWENMIFQTVIRYHSKYGADYVKQWNFETWNDPDCHDFDKLKMTVQGFLNYYDACSEGLKAVDPLLRFGGPADGCMFEGSLNSEYADALLNHTIRGHNYFTGETGVRIDFLSFNNKGEGSGSKILDNEVSTMNHIKELFPELTEKPYYNEEADTLADWSKPEIWRANIVYAALTAKVIAQHQNILKGMPDPQIPNYSLLGNDNAFLSWYPHQFTQRTLLARFQMNETEPNYVTFVRKPAYQVMTMLSLLGEKTLGLVDTVDNRKPLANTTEQGAVATMHEPAAGAKTSDSWQVTLLLYFAPEPDHATNWGLLNLYWVFAPTPDIKSLKLMMYYCEDPYETWVQLFNKTAFPTLEQFAEIRKAEVEHGMVPFPPDMQTSYPGVTLMHLCQEPPVPPEKVTGVRFMNVTAGQVMVVWSDSNIHTKCILTYEVELSTTGSAGPYTKVNTQNTIVTLFLYETDEEYKVRGYYRIRAVDYWKRGGEYSDHLLYSE